MIERFRLVVTVWSRKFGIKHFAHSWLSAKSYQQTAILSILHKTPLLSRAGGVFSGVSSRLTFLEQLFISFKSPSRNIGMYKIFS